jgi:hypothetical protein
MKTWLFWDHWHFEHADNMVLRQGQPKLRPDSVYEDPLLDSAFGWPCVWRDEASGSWRMAYTPSGYPLTVMVATSPDGFAWKPLATPDITPPGGKLAPHHVFTIDRANGGVIYRTTTPEGHPRFYLYCVQRGGSQVTREATLDTKAKAFHELVSGGGAKRYEADNRVAMSEDGLHWRLAEGLTFNHPGWHPDPPFCCFYDEARSRHVMHTRPGWGDRRIASLTSRDGLHWSPPEFVLQPDLGDPAGTQLYGMPVVRYEQTYVGFLWTALFDNSQRLERFNQLWGHIRSQLAYSFDGQRWQRGLREPFMEPGEPGEPGSGVLFPATLIDAGTELRIYSSATPDLHFQYTTKQYTPKGATARSSIVAHTLRRDGFMFLESRGNWARFTSKPLALLEPRLTVNIAAPYGELRYQLTDLLSSPLPGYTFGDCVPAEKVDAHEHPLRWKEKTLAEVMQRPVRLEMEFRNTRLYALRGNFHFLDALDVALLEDKRPIDPNFFDF